MARLSSSGVAGIVMGIAALLSAGCAAPWQAAGSTSLVRRTMVHIESDPPGEVWINGTRAGTTPLSLPLQYAEEASVERRHASYFRTDPSWAIAMAILSLGVTIPFNVMPTDIESRIAPLRRYRDNSIEIEVRREGYEHFSQTIVLTGQRERRVRATWNKTTGASAGPPELPPEEVHP